MSIKHGLVMPACKFRMAKKSVGMKKEQQGYNEIVLGGRSYVILTSSEQFMGVSFELAQSFDLCILLEV